MQGAPPSQGCGPEKICGGAASRLGPPGLESLGHPRIADWGRSAGRQVASGAGWISAGMKLHWRRQVSEPAEFVVGAPSFQGWGTETIWVGADSRLGPQA